MNEMNDISLEQQVEILKRNCIDRIANLVRMNGFDEGDEYVLEFTKIPRLVFYIDCGERICIDQISYVKESGDLFGENIEDFDNVVKYDMKKYFSVEDFAAIESHFDCFERPVLIERAKESEYVLIWEENDNIEERDSDLFSDRETAEAVMRGSYDEWVEETESIKGVEKEITHDMACVKAGKKNYYKARIIKKTMPFSVVTDMFGDCRVSEFFTYWDALKYVNDMGYKDYMIV